jgi:hypothetical protein
MVENYKHLYEQAKKMLTMYQDEPFPGFREQIEELEAKSKWIPVTERLPEKDGDYLVFKVFDQKTWCDVISFAKDGRKVSECTFGKKWQNIWYYYDSEWGYIRTDSVTHWMPLPEPPKEGE